MIAAEIGFAKLAQDKGQWTAFRKFAAADAVMFVPEAVRAADWLKGRADPPAAIRWQPHQAWSSCDGSLGVTSGAWQRPDGNTGQFTTVWQRQKDNTYRWVMDQGEPLAAPLAAPDLITAKVADCASKPAVRPVTQRIDGEVRGAVSTDGTLEWQVWVRPDKTRHLSVDYWNGSQWQSAIAATVGP